MCNVKHHSVYASAKKHNYIELKIKMPKDLDSEDMIKLAEIRSKLD